MAIMSDCIMLKGESCDALNYLVCETENCPFYKTKEQQEKIAEKCKQRLRKIMRGKK